jgi:hypothetical protein
MRREFGGVKIKAVRLSDLSDLRVDNTIDVRVEVELGSLAPNDVLVEMVLGHAKDRGDVHNPILIRLIPVDDPAAAGASFQVFQASHKVQRSGSFGYGIRVRAREQASEGGRLQDLVLWA